jgi:hypothetical protein
MAGVGRRVDWEAFWRTIGAFVMESGAPDVWFEMGISQTERWLGIIAEYAPPLVGLWRVYYGAPPTSGPYTHCPGRPNNIARFSAKTDLPQPQFDGLKGEAVTDKAFQCSMVDGATGIVVDPCIGKGMTARFAHRYGLACYGVELNPCRLQVTLDWLEQRGYGIEPILA